MDHHHQEEPSERLDEMITRVAMTTAEDYPLIAAANQQDLAASVASTNDTINGHGHQTSQLAAITRFSKPESWPLLRLFNETFVSLPINRCIDIFTNANTSSHHSIRDNRLCLIDWTRSKMSTWSRMSTPNDEPPELKLEPEAELESNFSVYQELININLPDSRLERTGGTLARLVYLSSSSLLSLVGIFTNLLILLIIVINTKQKCQHYLSRTSHTTSHTNYHYVLLFQLTLTGLLLGGYVLFITSTQLYMATTTTTTTTTTTRITSSAEQNFDHHRQARIMSSPMSIYLPHMAQSGTTSNQGPIARYNTLPASSWAILRPEDSSGRELPDEQSNEIASNNNIDRTKMIEEFTQGQVASQPKQRQVLITAVRCQEYASSEGTTASNFRLKEILFDLVASINLWTVSALAYDRYCAIAYPLEYLRSINAARAKTFLVILWSGALLTNVLTPLALDKWLVYANEQQLNIAATISSQQNLMKCSLLDETETSPWTISGLPLCLSCFTFVLVILMPLVSVTICNVSIYGIVRVHERRLSTSSGSQSSSGVGGAGSSGPGCGNLGAMASVASKLRLIEPTLSFYHNNREQSADKDAEDTSSLASSILGKLIRTSAQVGTLVGAHVDRRNSNDTTMGGSASSYDDDDEDLPEICNLIGAATAAAAEDGDSSSSCKSPAEQKELNGVRKSASAGGHLTPINPTIINRSRRLGSLNKLGRLNNKQQLRQLDDVKAEVAPTESRICFLRRTKRKLKRKLSDKEISLPAGLNKSVSRRCSSSFAPSSWSEQTFLLGCGAGGGDGNNQQARDCFYQADNCSLCNGGCSTGVRFLNNNNNRHLDSDGILRQIKMAGLSFAGIAINELMQPPPGHMRAPVRRTTLKRSSSCLMGNLTANSCVMNLTSNACCLCDQRWPSVIGGAHKKDSFVSLNMREDTLGAGQDKYTTRLESELHSIGTKNSGSTRPQTAASCQQHFNFGGTKSIAFNVVVLLILLLLICSLPQYCLLIINSGHGQLNVVSLLKDLLQRRLNTTTPQGMHVEQPVWLAYICRLLFLMMLPLNAWLYGIRSRSLKTTLRMVLRRYISKRQASIEINQRRKSNLSMRSRDSSLMSCRTNSRNSSLFFQGNHHQQASQHHIQNSHAHPHQLGCINGRVFRRCASFDLPATVNHQKASHQQQHPSVCQNHHHHHHECLAADHTVAAPTIKQPDQQSQRSHTNSIRFVLGGEDHAAASRTSYDQKGPLLESPNTGRQCMLLIPSQSMASSQNSLSVNSSMASSVRSLLSASILSSHSAALLLVNNQPERDESSYDKAAQGSANQLMMLTDKPLTSVLKKRDSRSSMIRHQDSYDSACSSACQKKSAGPRTKARRTLDRVQSSPGKLLIGVARPRLLVDSKQENDTTQMSSLISVSPTSTLKHHKQMVRQKAQDGFLQSNRSGQFCDDQIQSPPNRINERRTSSDIRLLLTSAEDEHTGEPSPHANTTDLLLNCDTTCCVNHDDCEHLPIEEVDGVEGNLRSELDNNNNNSHQDASRFQLEYYKQIKDAIGRYFLSRKADKRAVAARKDSDGSQFSFVSGQSDDVERSSLAAHAGMSTLRKNSLDSQVVWHRNKTHHHMLGHHQHHHIMRRGSHQLSTINPVTNGCVPVSTSGSSLAIKISSSIDSITSEGHNQVAGRHVAQQNLHLRPPNSLKLLLDHDNQQATLYASSLALSPIKETSSYASSNSSLNNQQQSKPLQLVDN